MDGQIGLYITAKNGKVHFLDGYSEDFFGHQSLLKELNILMINTTK